MSLFGIEIPNLNGEHEIEVEVKINGILKQYHYRVEIFRWEDCQLPPHDRAGCIKHFVEHYNAKWELANIGIPTETYIPITFRKIRL